MDLFKHRCGCGRILGQLEQCDSCLATRRAQAIAMAVPRHQGRIEQLTRKIAHIQDEFFRTWAEVPTGKLVEMVHDIQPVPFRPLRPESVLTAEENAALVAEVKAKLLTIPKRSKPRWVF